jgi:hypothetical protein
MSAPALFASWRIALQGNGKKRDSSKDARKGVEPNQPSAFARIDSLAVSSLSSDSLARYYAYKQALIDLEQDDASVISTLSVFVWDLFEGRSAREIH